MPDLSIIIISFNTKELTLNCLKSIISRTKEISYEVIVIDNASNDGSVEAIRELSNKGSIKVIASKKNLGFAKGNNKGITFAKGRYVLFLNPDTLIHDNVLAEMVKWMDAHPNVGISSCSLKNKDGSLQGTGGYFPTLVRVFAWMSFLEDVPLIDKIIKPFHPMHSQSPFYKGEGMFKKESERDWVTGAFYLVRREVLKDVGFFDENYFMYTEEVDFAFRAKKKGWKVWYLPKWSITHYGGASSTKEYAILSEYKGVKTFYRKNMPSWQYIPLRFLLKLGAFLRIFVMGILKGSEVLKTYAKAFVSA